MYVTMFEPMRRGFAEFVGAFTLIFIGAGAILSFEKLFLAGFLSGGGQADLANGLALVGVALAHGLAIAVMVSAVGHISGGHFNPAITLDILMGGPLTGAAMNPARAFGPQLVQRDWSHWWVWYAGPVVGACVAALTYEWLYLRMRPLPVGPPESGVIEPRPGETAVT